MTLTRITSIVLLGCVFISINYSKAQDNQVSDSLGRYKGRVDPENKVLGLSLLK